MSIYKNSMIVLGTFSLEKTLPMIFDQAEDLIWTSLFIWKGK